MFMIAARFRRDRCSCSPQASVDPNRPSDIVGSEPGLSAEWWIRLRHGWSAADTPQKSAVSEARNVRGVP